MSLPPFSTSTHTTHPHGAPANKEEKNPTTMMTLHPQLRNRKSRMRLPSCRPRLAGHPSAHPPFHGVTPAPSCAARGWGWCRDGGWWGSWCFEKWVSEVWVFMAFMFFSRREKERMFALSCWRGRVVLCGVCWGARMLICLRCRFIGVVGELVGCPEGESAAGSWLLSSPSAEEGGEGR